ncbi:OmpL47-type beta-barrel domain-containing protein [Umezawaea sp. Da 62-37]|uniref:cupredoxin domain-containing protein n=1 Tax=Umezawaea sp. Da 62-37 TaxID=3075927 RepID=UPI0028F70210|nr:plastocyanin/azurin family copper-binding protein [Umezawaea sp. Da 62-37]WNV85621.1 plastocyanin/azurin family copper-binding protein [Umezawaea sp. Da 62-37]
MIRRWIAVAAVAFTWVSLAAVIQASAAPERTTAPVTAQEQVLTWTADNDITRYKSAPTTAAAGEAKIVWENSEATGNTTGMPHTLTFDTSAEGFNHDVDLNVLANPFDAQDGRHEATVTLTPGKYRYFCSIPGHGTMVGEFTVAPGGEDTTPPTVTADVAGQKNSSGEFLGSATVTVNASDAGSGVQLTENQVDGAGFAPYTQPVRVTAVGAHTAEFRATDRAGNTSAVGSVSFRVVAPPSDTTPPVVSAEVTGTKDADGAYVGKATVTITATDSDSGVGLREYQAHSGAWTPYTAPFDVTETGSHMVHFRATDKAGNASPEGMVSFTVVAVPPTDTTPPTTSAAVTGTKSPNGDYVDRATVTITASDTGSGLKLVEYALDSGSWTPYSAAVVVTAVGAHTVQYRATDNAGNAAAARSVSFAVVGSGTDACPDSDERPTVVIGQYDTGVANTDTGNGCTVGDLVDQNRGYPDHGAFVRHVELVTDDLVAGGALTRRQQVAIVRAASRSDIGR